MEENRHQREEADRHLKEELRQQILARRKKLSEEYRRKADEAILERLLNLESYIQAETIFTYVSAKGEADTRKLIVRSLAAGKTVAVPRCTGKGMMKAFRIEQTEDLEPGAYGIPGPGKDCPELQPGNIGLAIIPCVSCTSSGVRLGYGGGYYDRYLPRCPAVRILLCYDQLILPSIPKEPHDCKMDVIITERQTILI